MSDGVLKRSYTDVMALRKQEAEKELARAQAPGGPVRVSRMAAAIFCNVSYDTMRRWEKDGIGPPLDSSVKEHPSQSGQDWVYYRYLDLVAWAERGIGSPAKRKKDKAHASAMQDEYERGIELRKAIELEALRRSNDSLQKQLEALRRKARAFGMANLQDLMVEQDWVIKDGKVLGHVLTVSDEDLLDAIERNAILEATLDQVLMMPWAVMGWRTHFLRMYFKAIAATDSAIEAVRLQQELDESLPPAVKKGGRKPL